MTEKKNTNPSKRKKRRWHGAKLTREQLYMLDRAAEDREVYARASPKWKAFIDETKRIEEAHRKREAAAEKQKEINKKHKEGFDRAMKKYREEQNIKKAAKAGVSSGPVKVEKGKDVKGSGVFKKIKGIPDKPVANAKQQKSIDHYKARGTTPRSVSPAGQFALSLKMWEAKYGEEYRREVRRLEIEASKTPETKHTEKKTAAKIREMLKKADPKPPTHQPKPTKAEVRKFVDDTQAEVESREAKPRQKGGYIPKDDAAGKEHAADKYKHKGKQVKFSGLPSWRDVVPDESEAGRNLKKKMHTLKTFEKMKEQIDKGNWGEQGDTLDQSQKRWMRNHLNNVIRKAQQEVSMAHGRSLKQPHELHGGAASKIRIPRMPRMGPGALVPILWLEEYIKTGKTPALIKDFLDIPNLPTYFKEAYKEIKDAIRNNKEKEAKNTLKHLIKRSRRYHPKRKK